MKITKSQLKEIIREELKLTDSNKFNPHGGVVDFKNSEWEVYVADEKGREKVVKKAKSKRAATILYNKIIKSDDYWEVGMRVVKEGKLNEDDFASKYADMIDEIRERVMFKSTNIVMMLNQQDKMTGTKNAKAYNKLIDTHFRKFIIGAKKIQKMIKD